MSKLLAFARHPVSHSILSFLFSTDIVPQNIALATEEIKYVNLMPVFGLNVYSMLKHDTLVLTQAAVARITEKLLFQFDRIDKWHLIQKFRVNQK